MQRIRSFILFAIFAGLLLKAIAQQGSSQSLGGVVQSPNGDSFLAAISSDQGDYYLFFTSNATNLLPGGNTFGFFVKNLRTGQVVQLGSYPRGASVLSANASITGSRFAAVYQLSNGGKVLFLAERVNTSLWQSRVLDTPGNFVVATDSGFFYDIPQADGTTVVRYLESIQQSPAQIYRAPFPVTSLNVSDDGRVVALAASDSAALAGTLFLRRVSGTLYRDTLISGIRITCLSTTGEYASSGFNIYQVRFVEDNQVALDLVQHGGITRRRIIDLVNPNLYVYLSGDGRQMRLYRESVDYPLHPAQMPFGHIPLSRLLHGGMAAFTVQDTSVGQPLLPYDRNAKFDVFVHDISTMQTLAGTIGPRPVSGFQSDVAIGVGTEVALSSNSPNLVSGKTTPHYDIFIDQGNQLTRILGVRGAEPNADSFSPSILGDTVAFASYASNLTPNDGNNAADIFLFERNAIKNITESANGDSFHPVLTNRSVVFLTFATNLAPTPGGLGAQAVSYDLNSGQYTLFTLDGDYFSEVEAVAASPSGDFIALSGQRRGPSSASLIFLYNAEGNPIDRLDNSTGHAFVVTDVSDEGHVVFHTRARLSPEDRNDALDVYLWQSGAAPQLISKNPFGGVGNADSYGANISADGLQVSFVSNATNLVPLDVNGQEDVFVYDTQNQWLYCATLSSLGVPEGGAQPKLSANGRHIAFVTGNPQHASLPFTDGNYVAIHTIGCVPAGDVNRDGIVDDADLLAVLFSFGNEDGSVADLNVDGVVDDSDLLAVLFNFGATCSFGVAGGEGPSGDASDGYELRLDETGRLVLYYHTFPRVTHIDLEAAQLRDIEFALREGDWPYPTVGGMINLWKQHFGDPTYWQPGERAALRNLILGGGTGSTGDFEPASGAAFNWHWTQTYAYQPQTNTYIRFIPRIQFDANACTNYYHAQAEGQLDLRLLGFGRDELAKFKARAGMTPGWLGWEAKAWVMGSQVWSDGWYVNQTSWTINRNYNVSRNLFDATYNFNILGIPCVARIRVDGYANATFNLILSASPPDVRVTFTPAAGANATFTGGVGGSVAGITVAAGLQLNLNPLLELSLPATARAWTTSSEGNCFLNASADVRLRLRALAGSLRAGVFTSCLGGVVCANCSAGQRKDISGFIPAICCNETCAFGTRKRRVEASFQVASWQGLNYNLVTILNQSWQWRIK